MEETKEETKINTNININANANNNVHKVRRGDIFEAERNFKVTVSNALSDFRKSTNGIIREIIIQYLDDGSGRFITHIVGIVPDYSNTVIDNSYDDQSNGVRFYSKKDYDYVDQEC